ncbi:MAG: peptidylprolyl isomerase [Candidatus Thalassarchaeaceae archaeon]|nr:peptidylprolyl isomerase [Candidatus Thalassarchaeaceae archaeon]
MFANPMPVPAELQKSWDSADTMLSENKFNEALAELREAWPLCENDGQKVRTLRQAGDVGTAHGLEEEDSQKRHWQKALKSYKRALKIDPKNKETRRSMNSLLSMMDEKAISVGAGMQFFDEGNPTPMGLVAMVIAGMLLLTTIKLISDALQEDVANPIVSLEVSYVDDSGERIEGIIEIELYQDLAPVHVENFMTHTQNFRYDFTTFHRVIEGFMIQGGDIDRQDGMGGYAANWYGYCNGEEYDNNGNRYESTTCDYEQWTIPDEADNGLLHSPGMLAMAKTSAANTGGSQFYIVPSDSNPSHLDGVHTVFGKVLSGQDHVDAISMVVTGNSDNDSSTNGDKPIDDVRLVHVTVNE